MNCVSFFKLCSYLIQNCLFKIICVYIFINYGFIVFVVIIIVNVIATVIIAFEIYFNNNFLYDKLTSIYRFFFKFNLIIFYLVLFPFFFLYSISLNSTCNYIWISFCWDDLIVIQ